MLRWLYPIPDHLKGVTAPNQWGAGLLLGQRSTWSELLLTLVSNDLSSRRCKRASARRSPGFCDARPSIIGSGLRGSTPLAYFPSSPLLWLFFSYSSVSTWMGIRKQWVSPCAAFLRSSSIGWRVTRGSLIFCQ